MKIRALIAALLLLGAWQGPAVAQTSQEERIRKMEQRIRYLENRVADQDKAIVDKQREAKKAQADKWFEKVEIGGVVELEFVHTSDYEGKSDNSFEAETVEIGIAAQIHEWVGGEIVLAWDGEAETVGVDVAALTVAQPDGMFSMTGGILYVPFGTFETNLLSDPLTLDIGEARETALQFGMEAEGVSASAFVFKGGNKRGGHDRIANYGFAAGFAYEGKEFELGANASYISDIAEADGFDLDADALEAGKAVPGAHASVLAKWGPVSLIGEYVTALKSLQGAELGFRSKQRLDENGNPVLDNGEPIYDPLGAKPSAWTVEAALTFEVMKSEITGAASYQRTREAVGLELPESRILVGVSVGIVEGVSAGAEIAFDKDYSEADGGTGENATGVTVRLAAEF